MKNVDDAYALTPLQEGMLYHCLQHPEQDVYISYITITLKGNLDVDRFEKAWQCVLAKHDALRTSFVWDGLNQPLQVVNTKTNLDIQISDWSLESPESQIRLNKEHIIKERAAGLSPESAPAMRLALAKLGASEWQLIWSIHHLLADGWSTPIILEDIVHFYSANTDPNTLSPQYRYASYVHWLAQRSKSSAESWWSQFLFDITPTSIQVPASYHVTPAILDAIPQQEYCANPNDSAAIKQYCQRNSLTLSSLVHGAWGLTISEYSGSTKPLFGTTVSGRHPELNGSSETVGLFLNTLPFTTLIDKTTQTVDFLTDIQSSLLSCAQHDNIALVDLMKILKTGSASDAFESIVVIESHDNNLSISNENCISFTNIDYDTHSHYPLALLAFPGDSVKFRLVFDQSIFSKHVAQALLTRFVYYINRLTNTNQSTLNDVLCTNDTVSPVDVNRKTSALIQSSVHQHIASIAKVYPNKTALVAPNENVSYQELDEQANKIANYINANVEEKQRGIGVLIDRSAALIVTILGILKSGRHYIPLDPLAPIDRTNSIIKLADIDCVISDTKNSKLDVAQLAAQVLCIHDATNQANTTPESANVSASDLAYIMFTSGSTGVPKGVCISHANLSYSTASRLAYYGSDPSYFLLLSSITFDSSVAGIYWSLCSAGSLILPKSGEEKELPVLESYIQNHGVTHTLCLPSLYQLMLDFIPPTSLGKLKCVIVAGEACTAELVRKHCHTIKNTELYNEYGPTEATVWCTVHRCSALDSTSVPIGQAIQGTTLQIKNTLGRQVSAYCIGEICVSGPGVSSGYYNLTEQSAQVFSTFQSNYKDPMYSYNTGDLGFYDHKGYIHFVGRKDRQIKIRGYRIEPGEIEGCIDTLPGITQAIVLSKPETIGSISSEDIAKALEALDEDTASRMLIDAENLHLTKENAPVSGEFE